MKWFDLISRWTTWGSSQYAMCKVRIDGFPSQAKITFTRFDGRPIQERVLAMSVTDEEIYEIHSLTARWLYAHYGEDTDALCKRHKQRFGDWLEEEKKMRYEMENNK